MKKLLTLLFALLASPVGAQVIPSGPFGSINYWGSSGSSVNLVPGLAGFCLTSGGTGQPVAWSLCPGATLASLPSINTNQFYGNVSGNFQAPIGVDVNTILNTVGYDISRPPAVESILYKSNVGPTFNWQTLPPGVQGSLLTSGGPTNPPFWAPTSTQADLSSICTTIGAVLYFDTPSLLWKCIAPGTSGQLLQTGGVGVNPSWFTVTPASVGAVPSTRNVNTSAPLGGGGPLSADLTLTCATCATTTNGGALSATSPVTISSSGVIACATCATTTNGGALSATAPITISAAGVISMTNQGTTTTVLHGNAAGNPSFGSVVSADMSITTTTCTNQFVTAISSGGVGTCSTATLASAQFANQGTTTTVLHGNAAGNPSFGAVAIGTDVSGLGTGVATALGNAANAASGFATSPTVFQSGAALNPTATASTTGVMMGLGSTCALTPTTTRVRLHLHGTLQNSAASAGTVVQARFGTGAAPANGVASTGTTVGSQVEGFDAGAAAQFPWSLDGIITGLTAGVAMWGDVSVLVGAGTGTLTNASCNLESF